MATKKTDFRPIKSISDAEINEYKAPDWLAGIESDPWTWWRNLMPVAQNWAYLDHAAVGPLSDNAASAMSQWIAQSNSSGDICWPKWASGNEKLRADTATLLNCDPSEVCLIPNTSTGINFVAEGWPWKPGDNVVITDGEFPSNLFPWQNQESRGVEVRIVPRRKFEVHVDDLIDAVDASTRIIAASWVGYSSGYRLDVDELVDKAHRKGVFVSLDAIQGLGVFPLDVAKTPVDFIAADGHKWLLGPEGAGIAMIRREHLDKLRLGNVGWGSVKNSFNYNEPVLDLRDEAARYESGSMNMVGFAGMSASLEIFLAVRKRHGESAIGDRVTELTSRLDDELHRLGATTSTASHIDKRSGIVTFQIDGVEPAKIRSRAIDEKIVLSCRGGGVRASVHAYNNDDDLGRLIELVKSLV